MSIVALLFALFLIVFFLGLLVLVIVLLVQSHNRRRKPPVNSAPAPVQPPTAALQPLSEVLKAHRLRCGLTQEQVAEQLGISRQAVSKWENGTGEPSTSNLLALARLYGVPAGELLENILVP